MAYESEAGCDVVMECWKEAGLCLYLWTAKASRSERMEKRPSLDGQFAAASLHRDSHMHVQELLHTYYQDHNLHLADLLITFNVT